MNPFRFLKNLFQDFLILTSGTFIGSSDDDTPVREDY